MLGLITKSKNAAYFAKKYLKRTLSDESGATAIEYGLMGVGIALAIIAAVFAIGTDINNLFFLAIQSKLIENTPT